MRRSWLSSLIPVLVPALALTLAGAGTAKASEICSRLTAQLASVSTSAGSSANYRRYADAVAKQSQQIRQVQTDLSRYGCSSGSFIVLGGRNAAACSKLTAAQSKMRANLAALERKRDSYSDRVTMVSKRRIQAALKANDCDGRRASVQAAALKGKEAAKRARSPGLVAILGDSGGRTTNSRARIVIEPRASRGGAYRTLCVRTCDGFFFPISSSASSVDFARDERTCQMMCPGTEAALYFHLAPDQESEEMVSARTREPYTALPNAFAYRDTSAPISKACGCNMGAFYKEMARREAILNGETTDVPLTTWVRPFTRPDPGEDPESIADADMRLTSEDVAAVLAASTLARPMEHVRREVRVVGPTFLPDQSSAIDLDSASHRLFR